MGPEPELPLAGQVAAQAEFVVNTLHQTDYQYTDNIDAANGVYDCDCSQFANYILSGLTPDHYSALVAAASEPVPRAFDYYDFISSLPTEPSGGWQQVQALADAARGDLIAWRLPPKPHQDTGHVVFVAETPTIDDSGDFYAVRVYDSAITSRSMTPVSRSRSSSRRPRRQSSSRCPSPSAASSDQPPRQRVCRVRTRARSRRRAPTGPS